jgi:MoxR-like ATPase
VKEGIEHLQAAMAEHGYITDRATATAAYLAMTLSKPLLIEGPAGVGKTEVAKVLARVLDTELVRLQCYEGLDVATALYEWNYPKQLLHIKLGESLGRSTAEREAEIFSEPFLLEVLSEHQVTIPEIGTVRAAHAPCVVLTSNRTRELSEALRRRCLYLWIDYPTLEKELAIVRAKVPGVGDRLAAELTSFIQAVRRRRLLKTPGVAETLDWAHALVALHAEALDDTCATDTLGCFLKDQSDVRQVRTDIDERGVAALVAAERGGHARP